MINARAAFSSFSAPDLGVMKQFYGDALGLSVCQTPQGLELQLAGGGKVFIYQAGHKAPDFTLLNFLVENIDTAVDQLLTKGIAMEQYPDLATDEKGICRNDGKHPGPFAIAWFKDPAGHIISVIQEK